MNGTVHPLATAVESMGNKYLTQLDSLLLSDSPGSWELKIFLVLTKIIFGDFQSQNKCDRIIFWP